MCNVTQIHALVMWLELLQCKSNNILVSVKLRPAVHHLNLQIGVFL